MKKLFSLLLVVAMLASFAVVASAANNVYNTTITETNDGITVVVTITNPALSSGFIASLAVPAGLTVDKTQYTLGADYEGLKVTGSSKNGNQVKYQFGHTDTANYVTKSGDVTVISFPLTRTDAEATFKSSDFSYPTGLYAVQNVFSTYDADADKYTSYTKKSTTAGDAAYFTAPVYVDERTVEEENPFSATAAGTTITCIGKVDATATNYGVVFTAESTVEGARAQKFYGAMDGDTVSDGAEGTTTFTFGDWDGSFKIILEGVHAGEKELDFFVNDTVIADTNFTLTVE